LETIISYIFNTKLRKEVSRMKKDTNSEGTPTVAEGIDTEDVLNKSATEEEIDQGDTTSVTVLSLDENDPS
jgi:hypothetical protein